MFPPPFTEQIVTVVLSNLTVAEEVLKPPPETVTEVPGKPEAGASVMLVAPATYPGVAPAVGVAPAIGVGCGATPAPRALATLMRPSEEPLNGSVAATIWSCAALLLLPLATSSAASPATWAAAGEVPL